MHSDTNGIIGVACRVNGCWLLIVLKNAAEFFFMVIVGESSSMFCAIDYARAEILRITYSVTFGFFLACQRKSTDCVWL